MANLKIPRENITGSFSLQLISGSSFSMGLFSPGNGTNITNVKMKQLSPNQVQIIMEVTSSLAFSSQFYQALQYGVYYGGYNSGTGSYSYGLGPEY